MNRRIRKKKRVGEFQEIGLEVEVTFDPSLDNDQVFDLWIGDAIEGNGLCFGGGGGGQEPPHTLSGIVELGRRDVASDGLDRLTNWLVQSLSVTRFETGRLIDLWHDIPVRLDAISSDT